MLVLDKSYEWLISVLATRFRVHVLQLPGSGHASRLPRAWSFDSYASWLTEFMPQLDAERPILVGHSNSGAAALLAAARRPDLFSRLILTDTVGLTPAPSLPRIIAGRAIDAALEWRLTLWGFHHILCNALRHTRNFIGQVRQSASPPLLDAARSLRIPTLLAWGRHDHTMPLRHAQRALAAFPDATLYISPTGSHDWLITHPHEFTRAVERFCTAIRVVA